MVQSKRPAHTARTAQQTRPAPHASCAACSLTASGVGVRSRKYLVSLHENARVARRAVPVRYNSDSSQLACLRIFTALLLPPASVNLGYSSTIYDRAPGGGARAPARAGLRAPAQETADTAHTRLTGL